MNFAQWIRRGLRWAGLAAIAATVAGCVVVPHRPHHMHPRVWVPAPPVVVVPAPPPPIVVPRRPRYWYYP